MCRRFRAESVYRTVGLFYCTVGFGSQSLVGIKDEGIGGKGISACIGFNDLGDIALGIICIIIAYSAFVVNNFLDFSNSVINRAADRSLIVVFVRVGAENGIAENIGCYTVLFTGCKNGFGYVIYTVLFVIHRQERCGSRGIANRYRFTSPKLVKGKSKVESVVCNAGQIAARVEESVFVGFAFNGRGQRHKIIGGIIIGIVVLLTVDGRLLQEKVAGGVVLIGCLELFTIQHIAGIAFGFYKASVLIAVFREQVGSRGVLVIGFAGQLLNVYIIGVLNYESAVILRLDKVVLAVIPIVGRIAAPVSVNDGCAYNVGIIIYTDDCKQYYENFFGVPIGVGAHPEVISS